MTISIEMPADYDLIFPYQVGPMERIGRNGDGGYVLPSSILPQTKTVISLGIGDDWSFETEFRSQFQSVDVQGCDF